MTPDMKYRRFGRTELPVPVFTCGGMRFQHKWQDLEMQDIPGESQENVERIVRRALDLGIHHFETARGYGSSELQLGQVLPRLPREKIIVQTKVGPAETAREFLENFNISLERLRLDYVDLFAIHGINNEETFNNTFRKGGCLEAARQLQKEGRFRFLGFSTHNTGDVILKAIRSGEFDYVNLHWYFVNDLASAAIGEAARRDMGVFIISPNDKGGKLYEPPPKLLELCRPLTPMQFNDLYCLARPQAHTLSIGAARPSDFDEHIGALNHYDNAGDFIRPIERKLRQEMARVLGADWCERWHEGIPEHDSIPGNISVKEIIRLWSHAKALDMVEFAKMRYNLLGGGGHWFPGMKATEFDDAEMTKALGKSPFAERIPAILREAHALLNAEDQKRLSQSGS